MENKTSLTDAERLRALAVLEAVLGADAWEIDGGPLLTSYGRSRPYGHPDAELLRFLWTDGQNEFLEVFTVQNLAEAEIDFDKVLLDNRDGQRTVIRCFRHEPWELATLVDEHLENPGELT